MNRWRKLAALCAVTALVGLALGCSNEAGDSAGSKAIGGGYGAPATVRLSGVVVGAVGSGILLQNHSDEQLESVEIVINEKAPAGGFRFRAAAIPPNSTQTYLTQVFKSAAGDSLNPMETKPTSFTVYADTPRGRGSWTGGYENQQ